MRISILIDKNNRIVHDTAGELPDPRELTDAEKVERAPYRAVRLPRRLVKYYKARTTWVFDRSLASWDLREGAINDVLTTASSFLEGRRAFRQAPFRPWKAGDPCHVLGEGSSLFFIEAVEKHSVLVNGCRESMSKLVSPSFLDLFTSLENTSLRFQSDPALIARLRQLVGTKKSEVTPARIEQAIAKLAQLDPARAEAILEMIEKQG